MLKTQEEIENQRYVLDWFIANQFNMLQLREPSLRRITGFLQVQSQICRPELQLNPSCFEPLVSSLEVELSSGVSGGQQNSCYNGHKDFPVWVLRNPNKDMREMG